MAKTKVDTRPESEMPVGLSFEIESFGMFVRFRVHIGCRQHGHDLLALPQANAIEVNVPAHKARLGELPLIRCVVVSEPAPSSKKTIATISRALMRSPSLRRGDPDPADDRKPDFNDRPGCPQPLDRGGS
jgi:hypothetical protein